MSPTKTILLIAATVQLSSTMFSAEEGAAAPVPIGDFSVVPMANLTSGTFEFHPKASAGVRSNSNLYATDEDAESDVALSLIGGIQVRWNASERWSHTFDGELTSLTYSDDDNDGANLLGGKASLVSSFTGPETTADLGGGYERIDDPLIETGESLERQTVSGMAVWSWEGIVNRLKLDANVAYTDYLEDGRNFTEESRDITVGKGTVVWGRAYGQDDYWYVRTQVERSDFVKDTQFNDSWALAGAIGLTYGLGERSRLVADAGVKGRRYSDDFTAGSDDQTVIGPFGQIGLQWPWEDGSQLTVSGFADTDNSTTANAQSVLGLRGDVTYRLRDRLSLLAGAEAVRTADLKTTVDESRVTLKATAGLQYALRDGIALRGLARGTTSSADVGEDYDRVELLGDIAVVF